jgi:hypothetical protein
MVKKLKLQEEPSPHGRNRTLVVRLVNHPSSPFRPRVTALMPIVSRDKAQGLLTDDPGAPEFRPELNPRVPPNMFARMTGVTTMRRARAPASFPQSWPAPWPMPSGRGRRRFGVCRRRVTLNQRVPGSSPGAPTKHFNGLDGFLSKPIGAAAATWQPANAGSARVTSLVWGTGNALAVHGDFTAKALPVICLAFRGTAEPQSRSADRLRTTHVAQSRPRRAAGLVP